MKKEALILMILLAAEGGWSQSNCFQFTSRQYNIIPNPSFEMAPPDCNSGYFNQFGLKIPSWTTSTDMILTGYLNACTNFLVPDTTAVKASAINPFLALYPLVPQPIPDGNGVAAVTDYGFTKGTIHVYPKYASYVSTCLPVPLEKDSLFKLDFYVGFGDHGSSSLMSYFNVLLLPQVSSIPEKFSLFGLQYCPASPDPILGCMAVPGWYTLGSVLVNGTKGSWSKASISFKSPDNILAIALGPSCDTTFETDQGNFNFMGKLVSTNNYAYFLDNLQLYKANVPLPQLKLEGSTCNTSAKIGLSTSFYFQGFQIQWFKDGVLIPNEQDSFLVVNRNTHGEGSYQCLVQNDSVCLLSDSLQIAWQNEPSISALGLADTLACSGDTVLLKVAGDNSFTYSWQDGSTLPYYRVTSPGTYTVTLSNDCGLAEAQKTVQFGKCNFDVYVPNAFTPNGDGHNDVFRIHYANAPEHFKMIVYNRYGQAIFSTSDPSAGWDGSFKGIKQATNTYIWNIEYTDHGHNSHSMKGTVQLIR